MSIDIEKFDFGFTAVDENELEAVQKTTAQLESSDNTSAALEAKLNKLYNETNTLHNRNYPSFFRGKQTSQYDFNGDR